MSFFFKKQKNIRREPVVQTLRDNGLEPHIISFVEDFLSPRSFGILWDGRTRGRVHMDQGSLKAPYYLSSSFSSSSPALSEGQNPYHEFTSPKKKLTTATSTSTTTTSHSYADDVNPLIISTNTSPKALRPDRLNSRGISSRRSTHMGPQQDDTAQEEDRVL